MRKEFEIHGCIEVPPEMTEEEFWNRFIRFVEENGWSFGGGISEIRDGWYILPDGMSRTGNRNTRPVPFGTPAFLLPGFPGRILGKTPMDTPRPDRVQ